MVYKQKNSTWNDGTTRSDASWDSRGCLISSKREFSLPTKIRTWLQVTSDVTDPEHLYAHIPCNTLQILFLFSKKNDSQQKYVCWWRSGGNTLHVTRVSPPVSGAPRSSEHSPQQHNGPPSSCPSERYGVPNTTFISPIYHHESCFYLTILCALPHHLQDARVLPNHHHSISTRVSFHLRESAFRLGSRTGPALPSVLSSRSQTSRYAKKRHR